MRFSRVLHLVAGTALLVACGDEGIGPTNAAPTAAFTVQCGPLDCTFTNSSTDADGTLDAYNWNFGDDSPHVTTRDAVHTYPAPGGRFTVTLRVTDDDGETATAARQVDVSEANVAPTAGFTVSCIDLTCTFSDGSSDGNVGGTVASYAWDFGDGETSAEANPMHGYAAAGPYTVALTVTDDLGKTGTVSRVVNVTDPPGAPAGFPPVPAGALTYVRVSAEMSGAVSRYVLYEDSTFALQYVNARWGFFEYTGRYARGNASIDLAFDANHGRWYASATTQGDSLVVTYNLDMMLSDFEDGVYRLAPTPGLAGIYLTGADGSNPRRLVTGERPAWSPNGRRIAFQRSGNIHLIGIDGTGETLLGKGREPAWHPDGTRLAFTSAEGIAVMREDGSGATTLVRHDFRHDTDAESDQGVGKPAWSPDGDRIAFEHRGDGDMMPAQIFVMSADGSGLRRVTSTAGIQYAESDPAWSPDGSEIVFWSFGYGIAVVSAAGGTPRQVYQIGAAAVYGAKPVWSPDGSNILFAANQLRPQGSAIWLVAAHGGPAPVPIAAGADPAWSPDGAAIAFGRIDGASLGSLRR